MSRPLAPLAVRKRQQCNQCLRPLSVCYCGQITCQPHNRWPVLIIQDIREAGHAIGTARIAALSLGNCQLIPANPEQSPAAGLEHLGLLQPALIYPGEQAADVATLANGPVRPLLFIDATWRRSRKIMYTQPWLAQLPRYALPVTAPSRYRIRQQPDAAALSTLEAIVYSLQQLEDEPARFDSLLATMDWVVDQQIKHRCNDARL